MFKLQRSTNKPSKPKERLDFKFSNFQALQVPKGCDRLFVTLTSVETGKTVAKLSKALVRNGACQWMETLSESFSISRDDSSKEYEESLVKIVVSTGSTRSGTLGEVTVNMASYISARVSAAVSMPLEKCSYGTLLQVKIQCLTLRSKTRDEESKSSSSLERDLNPVFGSQSDGTEKSNDSTGGTHSRDQATTSHPTKLESTETSQSTSSTYRRFHLAEDSLGGGKLFTKSASKMEEYTSNKRREGSRLGDSPVYDDYLVDNESPSNQSSLISKVYLEEDSLNETTSNMLLMNNIGPSKDLLEAAEETIDELRADAKMWERNSRKLTIDLDMSRKECSDLSKKQADLLMELSATRTEDEGLKREVEQLKLELQQLMLKLANQEDPTIQNERLIQIQKELENDMKHQKDLNASLDQQLRRTQDSNIELIAVLQELEETIEQQRIEIENLSSPNLDFKDLENSIPTISQDNRTLLLQLEELQGSEKNLQAEIQLLEESLRDKIDELENERKTKSEFCSRVERDYMNKMSVKEETITKLEERNAEIVGEVESLKEKIQVLESDCAELSEENLELLFKLKDSNKIDIREYASFDSLSSAHPTASPSDESEVSDDYEVHVSNVEEKFTKKVNEDTQNASPESSEQYIEIMEQLEVAFDLLMKPWCIIPSNGNEEFHDCINTSKGSTTKIWSAEYVLSSLLELNKQLENRISECDEINSHYEAEINMRDAVIADAKKKMEDCILVIKEHEQMNAKAEHDYANLVKELDEKSSEVDFIKAELLSKEEEAQCLLHHQKELQDEVSELQQRNSHLQQNLEVTLSEKNIAYESAENLQDEIKKLKEEFETQLVDLKQKFNDIEKQLSEAREECRIFEMDNQKLQASVSTRTEDSLKLHNSNSELNKKNQELHELCSGLASQLNKSKKSLFDCDKKVEFLENQLTSVLKEFAFRESILVSEFDVLVQENNSQKEKLDLAISVKTAVFESLEKEVNDLKTQISYAHEERERASLEAGDEVSQLLAERNELQALFQDVRSKADSTQDELDEIWLKYETEVQGLISQLAASQQCDGKRMADHERVLKSIADYKKSEEKLNTEMNDLELKLTISEYERQQLTKEIDLLKDQVQSISDLQNEISILKRELKECKLDNGKLELALQTISADYEELNSQKIALSEKISVLHEVKSEFEDCKSRKSELEEKILLMEKELAAKEILHAQNSELKKELAVIKIANSQFQQKVYRLEEEKDECSRKAQSLEEKIKEKYNSYKEVTYGNGLQEEGPLAVASKENRGQYESFSSGPNNFSVASKKSVDDGQVVTRQKYERTKSSLQTELRELRERYLEMSLKYAEGEALREDLVMKLKETKSGKRWFS